MKEIYVMNLDKRRIAIVAGSALTVLGICLIVGMAIGRGQGERAARILQEEADQKKLGMAPVLEASKPALASPVVVPVATAQSSTPLVSEPKSEIPVEADPMVAGPPKRTQQRETVAKVTRKHKKKKKADAEVTGEIEHGSTKLTTSAAETEKPKREHSGERFTIQVAAFKRANDAKGLIDKLKGEGIKAKTEKTGNYFLVTVGRTKSKDKLEKALARLKELEYEAYIRRIKPSTEET